MTKAGYSSTEGDVTSEITSWLTPQCVGKYVDVFVIQDSMTDAQGMLTDPPGEGVAPPEGVVTTAEELEGKWFATELHGEPVHPGGEVKVPVPYLEFFPEPSNGPERWQWSSNDGCNTVAGPYMVWPDGAFEAGSPRSITFMACPATPVPPAFKLNIKAVTNADQAMILPGTDSAGGAPTQLQLLSRGTVIGVYTISEHNEPLGGIIPRVSAQRMSVRGGT